MSGSHNLGPVGLNALHVEVRDGTSALSATPLPGAVGQNPSPRPHCILAAKTPHTVHVEKIGFPVLRLNASGPHVADVQRLLNSRVLAGSPLSDDGYFGAATEAAVVRFQRSMKLKPDGIVGRLTWLALASAPLPAKTSTPEPPRTAAVPNLKSFGLPVFRPVMPDRNSQAVEDSVADWSLAHRIEYVVVQTTLFLPGELGREFKAMVTGDGLKVLVGTLVFWAGAHAYGAGEVADGFLAGAGYYYMGKAAWDVAKLLKSFLVLTVTATEKPKLDKAAHCLADALSIIAAVWSITKFFQWLRRFRAGGAKGSNGSDEAGPPKNDSPPTSDSAPEPAKQPPPEPKPQVKPPKKTSLPRDPEELKADGYKETSHPDAKAAGHRTFENPETGDKVRFDKGKPGAPGYEGQDHYHRYNPDATGKGNQYLDSDGNPTPRGSDDSHLLPEDEE